MIVNELPRVRFDSIVGIRLQVGLRAVLRRSTRCGFSKPLIIKETAQE